MYTALLTLTTGAGLALLLRPRRPAATAGDPFLDAVAADAGAALSRHTGGDPDACRRAIRGCPATAADPALADVLRVEVTVRQVGRGGQCEREVCLAVRTGGDVCLLRAVRPVGWERLPRPVRQGFFQRGDQPLTLLLLDRPAVN